MNFSRIRITPHQLVFHELGRTRMSTEVLEAALAQARRRGYVANFVPPPEAYDQHLVLLLANHPFAAIYRAMAPDGSPTPVPRGLIESRTRLPMTQMVAGMILARNGLAVMRVTGCSVILRGTWTEMAQETNASRYAELSPRPCWTLVERATGMVYPPTEIDDDIRLHAAMIYDQHDLAVDGLLDGEDHCTPVSHWRFPQNQPDDFTPPF